MALFDIFFKENLGKKDIKVNVRNEEGFRPTSKQQAKRIIKNWVKDTNKNSDFDPVTRNSYYSKRAVK
jgi:hypothetical protein